MRQANAVLDKIDAAWKELSDLVAQLGPDGLMLAAPEGWAVKDHLVHVGAWEHSLLGLIEGRNRLAEMGVPHAPRIFQSGLPTDDTDAINDAVRKLHENETPESALVYFRESHAKVMGALGKLSEADLQKPYSHYQPEDADQKGPVIDWVGGNTWEHYAEHIGWINQLIESRAAR